MKLSSLSKTSLMLFCFFGIDKIVAILRQLIIARQFGLSVELDIFNIANNLPDMLFILISGGAMAMVVIPILTEVIDKKNKEAAWKVFSSLLNLAFLVSLILSIVIALFAKQLVMSEIGIAPGFTVEQQHHVINLMRLNLIATMVFSIGGLMMGALQANRKFLLPALAPILYNFGQIFGAMILSPVEPYRIGPIALPHFGMGIYGLVMGVILGAILYVLIQIPGLLHLNFRYSFKIDFSDYFFRKSLRIMAPRLVTVFCVQLIFIIRDNLASRLATGAVTALSYGYMFQQLPETLIGTALGTALLPSLSLFVTEGKIQKFQNTFSKSIRLVISLSFGIAVIMAIGLGPMVQLALGLTQTENQLLMWTLRGFLVGLAGHCMLEVTNRSFYAQQDAIVPFIGTILNLFLYLSFGMVLYRPLNAPGISLTDSIAFTLQAIFLLLILRVDAEKRSAFFCRFKWLRWLRGSNESAVTQVSAEAKSAETIFRSFIGALLVGGFLFFFMQQSMGGLNNLVKSGIGMGIAFLLYIPFIWKEISSLKQF